MDNEMFEANMGAIDILQERTDLILKQLSTLYMFLHPYKTRKLFKALETTMNATDYLIYAQDILISVEDN